MLPKKIPRRGSKEITDILQRETMIKTEPITSQEIITIVMEETETMETDKEDTEKEDTKTTEMVTETLTNQNINKSKLTQEVIHPSKIVITKKSREESSITEKSTICRMKDLLLSKRNPKPRIPMRTKIITENNMDTRTRPTTIMPID